MDAAPESTPTIFDLPSSPASDIADPDLSPASKKILEKFTVPAAQTVSVTDVASKPSLILRPKSSGLFAAAAGGFHFAKPARPPSRFSIRPPNKKSESPKSLTPSKSQAKADAAGTTPLPAKKQRKEVNFDKSAAKGQSDDSSAGSAHISKSLKLAGDGSEQSKAREPEKHSDHTEEDRAGGSPHSGGRQKHETATLPTTNSRTTDETSKQQPSAPKRADNTDEETTRLFVTPHPSKKDATPSTAGPSTGTDESTFAEDTQLTSPLESPEETPSREPPRSKKCETITKPPPKTCVDSPNRLGTGSLILKNTGTKQKESKPQSVQLTNKSAVPQASAANEHHPVPIVRPLNNARPGSQGQALDKIPRPTLAPQAQKPAPGFPLASKIMKRPMPPPHSRPLSSASSRSGFARQYVPEAKPDSRNPSEEDLFMMLIGRLKKREELENMNRAAKERLQKEFVEASQENLRLSEELKQAEERRVQQEEQLREQQEMIERWKAKFGKLKDLANDVGTSFDELQAHGRDLKETQQALLQAKDELQQSMRVIHDGNEKSQKNWHRYVANINDVKKGVIELETSVSIAETQAQERDRAIREERCRVAKLENHIRTYCIRQLKDTNALQNMESDLMSRVRSLSKEVESLRDSASGMSRNMGKDIELTLELLRSLTERDMVKPADITMIQSAIEEKWSQLKGSVEGSLQNLGNSLSIQTSQGDNITSKLAQIEGAVANIFETAHVLSKAQDTHNALQAKLDSTQQTLNDLTQERENLRAREHSLRLQVERMAAEIERIQKESIEAADARAACVSSEMQRRLEASQTALHEAMAQTRLKESALQATQGQVEEANKRADEAEATATVLQKEKADLEAKACQIELSVRQELTRASLAAKEQNKAWLEQEKHKLNREKQQSEKVLEAMKQQLEMTKASLEKANGMYEAVAAKEKDLKKQHDDLKKSATKNEKELQLKIKKLEDAQKTASKKVESFQHEDQRLRKEIESLQDQVKNNDNADALNKKVVELHNTIDDKSAFISSLQNQLGQMKDLEGEITKLRKEVNDKSNEMSTIRKQLEDMTASSDAAGTLLMSKDCEISELLGKLTLVEKERDALHNLQALADEKQRQLENIHSQKVRTDALISKAEISFRQLGLLTSNQSLFASWDALEGQLEHLVLRSRDPNSTEAGMMKEKPAGKRKRSAPHVNTLTDHGPGEGSTREVIYQTCRIRESGPSPVKKAGRPKRVVERKKAKQMDAPAIKPFSQLHSEAPVKLAPGTPAGMKDFDALLFSTPAEPQQEQQQQQQVEKIVDTQSTRKSSTEKMLLDEIETRQSQPGDPNHLKLPGQGQRPDSNGNAHIPETQMQGAVQPHHVSRLMPEKGILKDSSSMLMNQTPRAIRTPSNKITGNSSAIEMAVNGAFRRPSRIASKYFDPVPITKEAPPDTAVPSQAVVADETQPPRQLRKTKGRYSRKRGNYNDRFLRELKG